jgi:GAF domain-containing protein
VGARLDREALASAANEVVVLPIVCQDEVIAVLYGDNGVGQGDIPSSDLLQIFLLQAGMALENSRLRDKLFQLTTARNLPIRS